MKPGLQTAQSPSVEKKRGEASGAERGSSAASLQRHIFSSRVVSFVFPMAEDPTRFDKFLEGIRGDLGQRDRIRTRLLNANPIIESVETLQNVVRGNSKPEATALLERSLNLNELDASALAGLLVTSQAHSNLVRLDNHASDSAFNFWTLELSQAFKCISSLALFPSKSFSVPSSRALTPSSTQPSTGLSIHSTQDSSFGSSFPSCKALPSVSLRQRKIHNPKLHKETEKQSFQCP